MTTGALHYVGSGQPAFFPPDRVGYIRINVTIPDKGGSVHIDAPDSVSVTVVDRNGVAYAGRVVEGATKKYEVVDRDYEWRFNKRAVPYSKEMRFHDVNWWDFSRRGL